MELTVLCIALAVYYEARGEPEIGQEAVAQAVLNRVRIARGRSTACDVVWAPGQFSWADSASREPSGKAWERSLEVARRSLTRGDFIERATHFHEASIRPAWTAGLRFVGQFGNHLFWTALPIEKAASEPKPARCKP